MHMVDRIAGALFDLLELEPMPHTNIGNQVIQPADDHEPVITAGAKAPDRA